MKFLINCVRLFCNSVLKSAVGFVRDLFSATIVGIWARANLYLVLGVAVLCYVSPADNHVRPDFELIRNLALVFLMFAAVVFVDVVVTSVLRIRRLLREPEVEAVLSKAEILKHCCDALRDADMQCTASLVEVIDEQLRDSDVAFLSEGDAYVLRYLGNFFEVTTESAPCSYMRLRLKALAGVTVKTIKECEINQNV